MIRAVSLSALFLLTAGAHAQSRADSYATLSYSFAFSADSQQYAADVSIEDQGLETYNLIVPYNPAQGADNSAYFSPYAASSGNGSADASVNPDTFFDLGSQTGFSGVASFAERNPDGTADASVGTQETMVFFNGATEDVTIEVSALATATGTATATGGDTAQVDTYVGIYSFDFATNTGENPLIHIFGPAGGVNTTTSAEWSLLGGDDYRATYSIVVKAGTQRSLAFYTSTINRTAPVPEPASIAALGLGASAMLRRRKRA